MKYVIISLIMFCIFLINYMVMDNYENFYNELNKQVEMLNDRIDRILYVKVLQGGDTLYFTSNDLKDTFWIVNDTSWIFVDTGGADKLLRKEELSTTLRIEYGLEFTDTFSNDRYLTGDEGLYLTGNVIVYADQFSGNTYVINAEGDTIFKYIKKGGDKNGR